jgi:dihydrofolate reductase
MEGLDALLLGRRTYDIFAAYWPDQDDGVDGGIARLFNAVPKYVASRHAPTLDWEHSTLLGPDLAASIAQLRATHAHVHVIGSLDLVQSLIAGGLFDRLTLWVHPIVLGTGKRVFADGAVPTNLVLLEPAISSPRGAVQLRYARAEGTPSTGDMGTRDTDA